MESFSSWRSISSGYCCLIIKFITIIFLLFFAAAARPLSSSDTNQFSSTDNPLSHLTEMSNKLNNKAVASSSTKVVRRSVRNLSGPGSSPPRCYAKCGKCTPCRPVHVAVPPGTPVTAEYYPEAWRCKCGNKLYMP